MFFINYCNYKAFNNLEINKIVFNKPQVEHFILPNLYDLSVVSYPLEPDEYWTWWRFEGWFKVKRSSYYNSDRRQRLRPEALFTKAVNIAAEIDARIDMIGPEGQLLIEVFTNEVKVPEKDYKKARRMLRYISGWQRPDISYREYVNIGKKSRGS